MAIDHGAITVRGNLHDPVQPFPPGHRTGVQGTSPVQNVDADRRLVLDELPHSVYSIQLPQIYQPREGATFWGAAALTLTAGIGKLFGTVV